MNKKVLYGILLLSLFLLSTASMVQPVHGYTWGVPKQAIGVTSESEVSVYDKDGFKDSLGSGIGIKDLKDGDADTVGAKSKSKYLEMETDEDLIKYEEDHVYAAVDFEASADEIRLTLMELGNATTLLPDEELPPMLQILESLCGFVLPGDPITTAIATADGLSDASISSWADLMALYSDEYDGSYLTRDLWDFTEDAYKEKPDTKKDEVPFLADPRDWYSAYLNMNALGSYITGYCDSIQSNIDSWYGQLSASAPKYAAINATFTNPLAGIPIELIWALDNITLEDYPLASYILSSYIVQNVRYSTQAAIPDKFGFLVLLLEAGQPVYVPQADFLNRMLEEFDADNDFDGDSIYKMPYISYGIDTSGLLGAPGADLSISAVPINTFFNSIGVPVPLGGETIYINVEPEVSLEGGVITIEVNYLDGQLDPKDVLEGESDPNELDDWEWVFDYGDTGTSSETIKSGDTILWQPKGIEAIPGFEITIILGVSAISIIGIIYVIMKKRKM